MPSCSGISIDESFLRAPDWRWLCSCLKPSACRPPAQRPSCRAFFFGGRRRAPAIGFYFEDRAMVPACTDGPTIAWSARLIRWAASPRYDHIFFGGPGGRNPTSRRFVGTTIAVDVWLIADIRANLKTDFDRPAIARRYAAQRAFRRRVFRAKAASAPEPIDHDLV